MRFNWIIAASVTLLALGALSTISAQEPAPEPAPAEQAAVEAQDEAEKKKKLPFALYVEAGQGVANADTLDTSISTVTTSISRNALDLEDQTYSRAAIGWKLPNKKGDVRLSFTGYKEDGFEFVSQGLQDTLAPALSGQVNDNLLWWTVTAGNGRLSAVRTPPKWCNGVVNVDVCIDGVNDDANSNGGVDFGEVRPAVADFTTQRAITDDLQNRAQMVDLTYGRSFGRRRYSSRWFSGLRYSKYDGNVLAGAWLGGETGAGVGFTDGTLLRLLNFKQTASGFGPTGSLELDINYFDQRLQLFFGGQVAFLVMDISADSGDFVTLVGDTSLIPNGVALVPVRARLQAQRNKSTWQNSFETGVRIKLKSGVQLELAYNVTGLLDVVILPTQIRIPANLTEAAQGTSAIYNTQDYVLDAWRGSVAFQF